MFEDNCQGLCQGQNQGYFVFEPAEARQCEVTASGIVGVQSSNCPIRSKIRNQINFLVVQLDLELEIR